MSDAVELAGESDGGDRPAKKPKHNEIVAFGGPMDDEETARKKLKKVGFDPDRPANSISGIQIEGYFDNYLPMSYFCAVGDLRMCRYLLSKGASTTQSWVDDDDDDSDDEVNNIPSPMYAAAFGGQLEICKWLCDHGARKDIRKENAHFLTPLCESVAQARGRSQIGYRKICQWLILNEALCPRDNGFISNDLLNGALESGNYDEAPYWLRWADDAVETHNSFMTFLMGTYPRNIPAFTKEGFEMMVRDKFRSPEAARSILESLSEDQRQFIWEKEHKTMNHCDLQSLPGHPGIRKHIADLLGVKCGRDLRIMRNLGRGLRTFLGYT